MTRARVRSVWPTTPVRPRAINLPAIEPVLAHKTFGVGRYFDVASGQPYRDAVGELARAAGVADVVLLRIDAYSRGEAVAPEYRQPEFDRECNLLDSVLRAAYDLQPWDRAALCAANDGTKNAPYRWVAVCAAVKARNQMLARGLDPDADAPAYRHADSPQPARSSTQGRVR